MANRFTIQSRGVIALRLLPAAGFILLWWLVIRSNQQLAFFIGSPHLFADAFWRDLRSGGLVIDTLVTGMEALCGFFIGTIIGTAVGLWLSRNLALSYVAKPYIIALGSAPLFAFAPIIVLWFGVGIVAKILVAALSCVFVAILQAYSGAREVDPALIDVARSFEASEFQVFRKVVVPSALVWVMNGFRLSVGSALLGAFLGEYISSTQGLGHLILVAGGLYNIPLVLVGVSMIVALGLLLVWAVDITERLMKPMIARFL